MSIEFDAGPPTRPGAARRNVSAPSLINRIEKPPLLERLGQQETKAKADSQAPSAACVLVLRASITLIDDLAAQQAALVPYGTSLGVRRSGLLGGPRSRRLPQSWTTSWMRS